MNGAESILDRYETTVDECQISYGDMVSFSPENPERRMPSVKVHLNGTTKKNGQPLESPENIDGVMRGLRSVSSETLIVVGCEASRIALISILKDRS